MKTQTLIDFIPLERGVRYKRVTYVEVKKACGNQNCTVCRGRIPAHGPYWQRIEWDETARRKRTTYVGKRLPPEVAEVMALKRLIADPDFLRHVHHTEELLQDLTRRQEKMACLQQKVTRLEDELARAWARTTQWPSPRIETTLHTRARTVYHNLANKYHPDRNQDAEKHLRDFREEAMKDINTLWTALTAE